MPGSGLASERSLTSFEMTDPFSVVIPSGGSEESFPFAESHNNRTETLPVPDDSAVLRSGSLQLAFALSRRATLLNLRSRLIPVAAIGLNEIVEKVPGARTQPGQ